MNEEIAVVQPRNPSQQALYDLILWARDHPKEWFCACHPDSYGSDLEFFTKMIESLYRAGLYTVVLLVLYSDPPHARGRLGAQQNRQRVPAGHTDAAPDRPVDAKIRTVQRLSPSEI